MTRPDEKTKAQRASISHVISIRAGIPTQLYLNCKFILYTTLYYAMGFQISPASRVDSLSFQDKTW